ncbi:hypothetical protein ACFX2I_038321 [Malus domestica]
MSPTMLRRLWFASNCRTYRRMSKKCGNNAQPQSLVDQVTQYCKLGCSLHRCSKYKNGMYQSLLMHTCLECWKPLGVVEILKFPYIIEWDKNYNDSRTMGPYIKVS